MLNAATSFIADNSHLIDSTMLFVTGFLVGGIFVGVIAHHVFDSGFAMGVQLGRVERLLVKQEAGR